MSQKWYGIDTQLQWNTNKDLHMSYTRVSFPMTFSDLAKYAMMPTQSTATAELLVLTTTGYLVCVWWFRDREYCLVGFLQSVVWDVVVDSVVEVEVERLERVEEKTVSFFRGEFLNVLIRFASSGELRCSHVNCLHYSTNTRSSAFYVTSAASEISSLLWVVSFKRLGSHFCCDAMQVQPMPSCGVCPSVCYVRVLSKRMNISSIFFTVG